MKKAPYIVVPLGLVLAAFSVAAQSPVTNQQTWAQPVDVPGVPNLHKVNEVLYRSAQPTAEGMRNLKKMGIRTVVNLRSFHTDKDEIGDSGLANEQIPMKAWHPEQEDVVKFLRVVGDTNRTPALIHCMQGADRTGTMCAMYRVAIQGWTKEQAVREMTEGGFGFHEVWMNLPPWIQNLDIESIKKQAGIKGTESGKGR